MRKMCNGKCVIMILVELTKVGSACTSFIE